jgi:hypothetical protein
MTFSKKMLLLLLTCILVFHTHLSSQKYLWLEYTDSTESVLERIDPPEGFERIWADQDSFASWLRGLPLKPAGSKVYLYDGRLKGNQTYHHSVIDIDIGHRNLQQCADAVIRLRSEYLYSVGFYDSIHFNFTSGDTAAFRDWINGYRPDIKGNQVTWSKITEPDSSYENFQQYLNTVFMYAGSYSLEKELIPVAVPGWIESGNVFIQGGFPGHAVIVLDVAVNQKSGQRVFLLAQSFMPAQDIHIMINPNDSSLSPWYDCIIEDTLVTTEWNFIPADLMRFDWIQ